VGARVLRRRSVVRVSPELSGAKLHELGKVEVRGFVAKR
jgi:hypothetical protein